MKLVAAFNPSYRVRSEPLGAFVTQHGKHAILRAPSLRGESHRRPQQTLGYAGAIEFAGRRGELNFGAGSQPPTGMGCVNSTAGGQVGRKKKKKAKKNGKASSDPDGREQGSVQGTLDRLPEQELKMVRDFLTTASTKGLDVPQEVQQNELLALLLDVLKKVTADKTAELSAQFEENIKRLSKEHSDKIEDLQRSHDEEVKCMRDSFKVAEVSLQGRVEALAGQVEALTSELKAFNDLKQRVAESTLKRDLNGNIQAQGSPGEFWEQELESLLFVIEMKSELLQEKEKKLRQMEILVARNRSLEDQAVGILQKNEDLRVRSNSYQSQIQQMSLEQVRLMEDLEQMELMNVKLTQEKEELLYKLQHRESCSTTSPSLSRLPTKSPNHLR
ncbi:coiled-coil domain-containing protein 69 [Brienomyrus brachyistius]|uniref:coiled-coil domain-containing protein 69 n=1 Tax=Brienomyrus brachyistius TaxID=42636 RepID=UPI0020B42D4F|nr:coiled-coil domain-containing protein 69 [Brienomyrus brachyistius]